MGERKHVAFDNAKDEAILFTQKSNPELKRRKIETKITVREHIMSFNTEANRWLEVYLDLGIKFTAYTNLTLEKVRKVEDIVQGLAATRGLAPGAVRCIKVAAVQLLALYGAEIW